MKEAVNIMAATIKTCAKSSGYVFTNEQWYAEQILASLVNGLKDGTIPRKEFLKMTAPPRKPKEIPSE